MTPTIDLGPNESGDHLFFIYRDEVGRVVAIVFPNGAGDFRIGTLGLPRTTALDRRYATMAEARQATEAWAAQVMPLFLSPPDNAGDATLN